MFWKKKPLPFSEDEMKNLEAHAFTISSPQLTNPNLLRPIDEMRQVDGADYRILGFVERALKVAADFALQKHDFDAVLPTKFRPSEITFERFQHAVQSGAEIFENNLRRLPYVMRSAVRTDAIRERDLIEALLAENESLLQATAALTAELSVLDTDTKLARAESACQLIEDLRQRAHLYAAGRK